MPYNIKTKDGIVINNIPDAVPNTDQTLKDTVAALRAAGQIGSFEYSSVVSVGSPSAGATAAGPPPTTTTTTTTVPQPTTPQPLNTDPKTSLLGMMGGVVRGAGPIAMGAAAGAAMGGPAGAIAGAGAAGLAQFVYDPVVGIINNLFGTKYTLATDALEDLFTRLGVAEPKTAVERTIQVGAAGAAGGLGSVALGQTMQAGAGLASSATKGIGSMLASQPVQQVTGGLGAGLGSQIAAEANAPPAVQLGASLAGSMLGSAVGGGVKVGPAPTGPIDEAAQAKIRLYTEDIIPPQTPSAKLAQSMGDKMPYAGMAPGRVAQQAERINAVRDLARQYGADSFADASNDVMADLLAKRKADHIKWVANKTEVIDKLSTPRLGQVDNVVKSVTGAVQKALPPGALSLSDNLPVAQTGGPLIDMFRKPGTTGPYGSTTKIAPNTIARESFIVPMPVTEQLINDTVTKLEQLSPEMNKPIINVLNTWKKALTNKDLSEIEWLRKQIGESFKAPELATVRTTGEELLTNIYGAFKVDMTDFIAKKGAPADLNKWEVANKELTKMMEEIKLSILKSTLKRGKTTPEVINKMLLSTKRSDVEALYRNLSPDGQVAARTAIIADAVKKSGGLFELNPDRFVDEITRLGDQVGVLFSIDDTKQINGLVRVLKATEHAGELVKTKPIGFAGAVTAVGLSAAALTKLFGSGISGFLGTMGIVGGMGGAARLYNSKPVRDILMKIPSVRVGSAEEAKLFKRLLEVVQAVQNTSANESRSTTPGGGR